MWADRVRYQRAWCPVGLSRRSARSTAAARRGAWGARGHGGRAARAWVACRSPPPRRIEKVLRPSRLACRVFVRKKPIDSCARSSYLLRTNPAKGRDDENAERVRDLRWAESVGRVADCVHCDVAFHEPGTSIRRWLAPAMGTRPIRTRARGKAVQRGFCPRPDGIRR